MDIIKEFKSILEKRLDDAKGCLILNDAIQPLFIYWSNDSGVQEIRLTMEDSNKEKESRKMARICSNPKIACAAVLMDVHSITVLAEEADSIKSTDDYSQHPDSIEALYLVLFTKNYMCIKSTPYMRRGERSYMFGNGGWVETKCEGYFRNPFLE